jgi:hypothetical protein
MRRGAIQTEDAFSLEEIADLLASLGPEAIETIAQLVKQRLEQARSPLHIEAPPIAGY